VQQHKQAISRLGLIHRAFQILASHNSDGIGFDDEEAFVVQMK
jgi:hypothetical protein